MKIVRLILGIVIGLFVGAILNGTIINLGMKLVPLPEGVNFDTPEGQAKFQFLTPIHFLYPFLAHALGTLVGAIIGVLIAGNNTKIVSYVIGAAFFTGGVMMVMMIKAPLWFNCTDLIFAYFPMAFIATRIKRARKS